MIRPDDFAVEHRHEARGMRVVVTHRPSGAERDAFVPLGTPPDDARDRLVRELVGHFLRPDDLRIGRGTADGAEVVVVEHVPTGRTAQAAAGSKREDELVDELLDALFEDGLISAP